VTISETIF